MWFPGGFFTTRVFQHDGPTVSATKVHRCFFLGRARMKPFSKNDSNAAVGTRSCQRETCRYKLMEEPGTFIVPSYACNPSAQLKYTTSSLLLQTLWLPLFLLKNNCWKFYNSISARKKRMPKTAFRCSDWTRSVRIADRDITRWHL